MFWCLTKCAHTDHNTVFIKKSSLGTQQTYYNVFMYNIFSNLHHGFFPYSTMHRLLQMGYQEIPLGELLCIWMMILLVKDNSGNINFLSYSESIFSFGVLYTLFIFKFIYKLDVTLSHILDTIKSLQDINQGTNKCQKESFRIKSTSCLCEDKETFYFQMMLFSCGFTW